MQLVASSKATSKPAPKPIPDHAPNGADPKATVDARAAGSKSRSMDKKKTSALLEKA